MTDKMTSAKDCCTFKFIIGQLFQSLAFVPAMFQKMYLACGLAKEDAGMLTSGTLVLLSALATGLGWYQKLAARAGAGTLVPITGFANAVVSPAIEFRVEGLVTGTAAKMFLIAGPVIVYGTLASVIWGVVCSLMG